MFKFDFTGKTALVTGGAEGLGKEFVQTLAEQGADVAFVTFRMKRSCYRKRTCRTHR